MYYSTKLLETTRFGDIFQVNAIDLDAPNTPNSKINYRIESGGRDKFNIDSNSGIIRISENTNLDRDIYGSFYTLKIVANDFGPVNINDKLIEQNQSSIRLNGNLRMDNICYLMIEIIDVNNKKPEFIPNVE